MTKQRRQTACKTFAARSLRLYAETGLLRYWTQAASRLRWLNLLPPPAAKPAR